MKPVVAVVGRPNVGKSTLVNRILGRREAIVEKHPGVTRDRKAVDCEWQGRGFTLLDTGGWSTARDDLDLKISAQAEEAMLQADAVLFVVDSRVGVTDDDEQVARVLYDVDTSVLVVANKVDNPTMGHDAWELLGLGLGPPHEISALHGTGTADLLDSMFAVLDARRAGSATGSRAKGAELGGGAAASPYRPGGAAGNRAERADVGALVKGDELGETERLVAVGEAERLVAVGEADGLVASDELGRADDLGEWVEAEAPGPSADGSAAFSVVLVGRPNVGKSTLLNRLAGAERVVVHDLPGTTRDTIDTLIETDNGPVRFIDTAGMRRRARVDSGTEYYSLVRALKAVDTADVALLVIDATVGVTHQDQRLAERVDAAGCPIVVVLNKWDLLRTEQRLAIADAVARRLGFLASATPLRMSALSGKGVDRLWPRLNAAVAEYRTRIPTRRVNEVIRAAQTAQPAPGGARILYATQVATDPPTFALFANRRVPRTYLRYIERKLREHLDLATTALKFRLRLRDD